MENIIKVILYIILYIIKIIKLQSKLKKQQHKFNFSFPKNWKLHHCVVLKTPSSCFKGTSTDSVLVWGVRLKNIAEQNQIQACTRLYIQFQHRLTSYLLSHWCTAGIVKTCLKPSLLPKFINVSRFGHYTVKKQCSYVWKDFSKAINC